MIWYICILLSIWCWYHSTWINLTWFNICFSTHSFFIHKPLCNHFLTQNRYQRNISYVKNMLRVLCSLKIISFHQCNIWLCHAWRYWTLAQKLADEIFVFYFEQGQLVQVLHYTRIVSMNLKVIKCHHIVLSVLVLWQNRMILCD